MTVRKVALMGTETAGSPVPMASLAQADGVAAEFGDDPAAGVHAHEDVVAGAAAAW